MRYRMVAFYLLFVLSCSLKAAPGNRISNSSNSPVKVEGPQSKETVRQLAEKWIEKRKVIYYEVLIFGLVVAAIVSVVFVFKLRKLNRQKIFLNKKLTLKNERLKELNEGKNKLFSILSHDLRSPLGSMTQLLYLIKEDDLSPQEKAELLDEMQLQLSATNLMLCNLLKWASSQFGGARLVIKKVNLIEKVQEIIDVNHLVAKLKLITIKHVPKNKKLMIQVDEDHLKLILNNLLSNALKYTPPQKNIEIGYLCDGDHIYLKIFNDGKPISQKKIKEIEESDVKLNSKPGTTNELGTGLGLLLTKQCLHENKAELEIRGIPEKGTEFKICFPQATA